MSLFALKDLRRWDPSGVGSLADRHKKLFPGVGSPADREAKFLTSKGFPPSVGTVGDRWRRYLSVKPTERIAEVIRRTAVLP